MTIAIRASAADLPTFSLRLTPPDLRHPQAVISGPSTGAFAIETSPNMLNWKRFLDGSCAWQPEQFIPLDLRSNGCEFFRCTWTGSTTPQLRAMVQLPGGSFAMGHETIAPPVHTVTLSPFKMDVFEVTGAEWDLVRAWATNGLRGARVYQFSPNPRAFAPDNPVVFVSWFEAIKWANARSEMEGLDPVYYTDPTFTEVVRSGVREISNDAVNWAGSGYRLPTEAEWEYAAVSGEGGNLYPWGTAPPDISMLNYFFYYGNTTTPVGSFRPNKFGLLDMAGNVREWCWDLHKYDPLVS